MNWLGNRSISGRHYSVYIRIPGRPALWELTDSAPDPSMESKVRAIAANQRGIIGLDKCHVRKMRLSFYVDPHIVAEVLKALPQVSEVLVQVEPEEELAAEGQKDGRP